MVKFEDLIAHKEKICVVGLGYVGFPLAMNLAKHFKVVGFDVNKKRIEELKKGVDSTREIEDTRLNSISVHFTCNEEHIKGCKLIIVAVPTPIDKLKNPDLSYLRSASELVGRNLSKDSVVVYESTVYPGATEEICVPILEKESSLKWKKDFFVGYSPERVNPGDRHHTLEKITKVVSGDTPETTNLLDKVYSKVIKAGIYKVPSIKIAEAAKVLENIQRDINIALMNEVSIIFHRLGIDTKEVIEAASTKWNFINFEPGLVGGHCVPVDPYYLIYKSILSGYVPEFLLSARAVNEYMPKFIAHETIKLLIRSKKDIYNIKILILGITFKENVPDIRNSKVYEVLKELMDYGLKNIYVYDPIANEEEVCREFNVKLLKDVKKCVPYDVIIYAVKHAVFSKEFTINKLKSICSKPFILIDIKGVFRREDLNEEIIYWRL